MQEMLDDLLHYLRGVWLKRRFILIATWIICPIGWAAVTMMPNTYTAEARVYADTRSLLQPLLKGVAIQTDPTRELALMVKTLLSRTNLEKIVRASDSDLAVSNEIEYERLLQGMKERIKVRKTKRENLYTISFEGRSPQHVKNVVQASLDVFVENALGEKRQDTDTANQFLNKQIDEYEARLEKSEKRLADFKREYVGLLPGEGTGFSNSLKSLSNQLDSTLQLISETQTRLQSARTQLAQEEAQASLQQSSISTEYDQRILNLQTNLDELLLRYTENHPDVIEINRQIGSLEAQKARYLETQTGSSLAAQSPIYQGLKVNVSSLENELASLRARETNLRTKVEELEGKLAQVPDVEAKLTGLNREYQITKRKYEELLTRRESALISQQANKTTDDIKFRVIDPPRVPLSPSGPKRPFLVVAVLLLGAAVGVGLSFLFSQFNPVISGPRQLYQQTGFPVLGVVSATEASGLEAREKRKVNLFISANIVLAGVFIFVMAINMVPELHDTVMRTIQEVKRA